jgi:hypothetical protein
MLYNAPRETGISQLKAEPKYFWTDEDRRKVTIDHLLEDGVTESVESMDDVISCLERHL